MRYFQKLHLWRPRRGTSAATTHEINLYIYIYSFSGLLGLARRQERLSGLVNGFPEDP